jgi:hopanoid biosynthesis associated RND transporter like protein HpnN
MWWTEWVVWTVEKCRGAALPVAAAILIASGALGFYAASHLSVDADESKLLSANVPWQQRQAHYDRLFPNASDQLVIVVDGATPEVVDAAAASLAKRLAAEPTVFQSVERPDAGPFFRKNGLLFLDESQLTTMAENLVKAQPMIGGLTADPSLRGLFGALRLALQGVQHGDVNAADLSGPISAVATAIKASLSGRTSPVSWSKLLTGEDPMPEELRRFIITRPVLDYSDIEPGRRASEAVRAAVRELGLADNRSVRVRMTGSVALNDEELASVTQGAALSAGLSIALVLLFLFLALRSARLMLAIFVTLAAGFACTAAFAAAAVGTLNVISVAFIVMFVGIAVDFAIQFTVRFRAESFREGDDSKAVRATAMRIGQPLPLAAVTTALGFLSFVPTDYTGLAELGLIAAAGMLIAVTLTFTLLPALLVLVRPSPEPARVGVASAAPVDRFLARHHRAVLGAAALIAVACAATLPWVQFDFNPLHLKDPRTESMATLLDLQNDPATAPFSADMLAPSAEAADALAGRLRALPPVGDVVSLDSFVPKDQDKKLAILSDLAFFLLPAFEQTHPAAPPDTAQVRASAAALLATLREVIAKAGPADGRGDLEQGLAAALAAGGDAVWSKLHETLIPGLMAQLQQLREGLGAAPIERKDLPPDLVHAWVASDGEYRVQAIMRGNVLDNEALGAFHDAVLKVAPDAVGPAITIPESAATITHALVVAALLALATITLVLLIVLRSVRETLFVLIPLAFAALLTLATGVVAGLPLNFANVIALPLLLGIGVAFDIYFVSRWREGIVDLLQSATARAVVFSALTTIGAFGTLVLSHHRGTAEMGALLVIALGYALLATLFVLPPLMRSVSPPRGGS